MKTVIRIFNFIFIAISGVAIYFMLATPLMTFKSRVALKVDKFAKFLPENEYTSSVDVPNTLGAKVIYLGLSFNLDNKAITEIYNGDKTAINNHLLNQNIQGILNDLHEPINIITEIGVKKMMSTLIKDEITAQIDSARDSYGSLAGSTQDIMDETGINDKYFANFSTSMYQAANIDGATVDSICVVLDEQINNALIRAAESGFVDPSSYSDEAKAIIKEHLLDAFNQMNLVNPDNTIIPISELPYMYIVNYYKDALITAGVSDSEVAQKDGETYQAYSDRLLGLYVTTQLPPIFYQIVGYVALALYISQYVFIAIWGILALISLLKTFSKKPWTIFGPWFWILGFLQVAMGIGMLVFGKMILPTLNIPIQNFPVTDLIFALRTSFLIPSILYLGCIVLAFIYGFFKRSYKRSLGPTPDKLVVKE